MTQLFTAAEIAALTGGRLAAGDPNAGVSGIAWDSRLVRPGDCFVALAGERADGHDFAAQAAARGAACVLAARPVPAGDAAVVVCPDPLLGLGRLGLALRSRHPHLRVVGITGSVGKTTTKEMTAAVLAERFRVFRTEGNLNSEVGLPASLAGLTDEHQAAVLEMGMRAPGEIAYLASIARPQVGVVTNVGITHLELLGTQENIALAKSELVRALPPDGVAVLNADDPRVRAMAAATPARVWFYGLTAREAADDAAAAPVATGTAGEAGTPGGRVVGWVTAENARPDGPMAQRFRLVCHLGEADVRLPAPGPHNLLNALAAAAVGLSQGLDLEAVARGLSLFRNAGNRLRLVEAGGVRILDDTYNAAPASVIAALEVMRGFAGPEGRCVAVLGDMYELGALEVEGHRQVGMVAARLADELVAVGQLGRHIAEGARAALAGAGGGSAGAGIRGGEGPPEGQGPVAGGGTRLREVHHVPDNAGAIAWLKERLRPGDTVLVKGSRGMKMEEIVQALAAHLDRPQP
ncbi:UDP-N-acetylmuramoyl-tripeptide--D-alanyl-D-alanine ligase [Symbiobacterium thermophilum]|uniref:UDP-N-acetylmuramoyl-tripeptide--D-alanyl-D- alanine ligase n=1 Tax=Symbiobacterium thermophilum TaxID=2734 RepID=UPI002354E782|nr:UDP-N-acetylmuramoyl-tripeptide--D-alanyl-D-alanine ligase [Symbiobacterium thermophilum]